MARVQRPRPIGVRERDVQLAHAAAEQFGQMQISANRLLRERRRFGAGEFDEARLLGRRRLRYSPLDPPELEDVAASSACTRSK